MKHTFWPFGGGGSKPKPPPPPPPPPKPPKKVDPAVREARTDEMRRAARRRGQGGTIRTGAQGVLEAGRTTETLLG